MTEKGWAVLSRGRRDGLALAMVVFFFVVPASMWAQRGRFVPRRPPKMPRQNQAWRRKRIQQDKHRHSANFFQRLRDQPPAQQDKILRNDAQFHNLSLLRRQQIRANLRRWNSLTPHQKQVLRQREEIVQSLSPAQRQDLRNVFPQYRRLPPGQQQQVMRAFRRLRDMPPAKRQRLLNSPGFQQRFTPQQQNVLRGLSHLLH
ncbi:MAG: DUF3106 domain-containing protein [Terriglobia bacterium]